MRKLIRRALALALALLTTGGASAAADTITVTTGPDPTEEVPIPFTVSWNGTAGQVVFLTKKTGQTACGATAKSDLDVPESFSVIFSAGGGATAGTEIREAAFSEPGTYTVCAFLQADYWAASASAVSGPVFFTVRPARATAGVTLPQNVRAGQSIGFTFPVTAELGRSLYVTIKPVGGRGCEAAYSLDDPNSEDVLTSRRVQGTENVSVKYAAPKVAGRYLLCAYVQERSDDLAPEARSSATLVVGSDHCSSARATLRRAEKAARVAEGAAARARKALQGARKDAARKRRYYAAVRARSEARSRLRTARADVRGAC